MDADNPCAVIPMPGCYVAYICQTDEYEGDDGCWRVNAEVCDKVESLGVTYSAAQGAELNAQLEKLTSAVEAAKGVT